jgi:hypothetical protein
MNTDLWKMGSGLAAEPVLGPRREADGTILFTAVTAPAPSYKSMCVAPLIRNSSIGRDEDGHLRIRTYSSRRSSRDKILSSRQRPPALSCPQKLHRQAERNEH